MNQNKQGLDIHKSLFDNSINAKDVLNEERKQALKSQIMMKNVKK